jgi:hypothetical protein
MTPDIIGQHIMTDVAMDVIYGIFVLIAVLAVKGFFDKGDRDA